MDLDRYQRHNAAMKIEGYFFPKPLEAPEKAFERARAEAVDHLKRQLQQVESIDFAQYQAGVRNK